jgi:hypothetical protein
MPVPRITGVGWPDAPDRYAIPGKAGSSRLGSIVHLSLRVM